MIRTVTRLREQGRDRVRVDLDGEPWRVLPAVAVVRSGLRAGAALDRALARRLARELRRADALERAQRALSVRDRSREELEERLARAGAPAEARAEALATLAAAGLLDDERVAGRRAQELDRRGYGDAAIRADLERRGLSAEAVEAALAALEPELDRARRLLPVETISPQALRRLAARGFSAEVVEAFAERA